MDFEKILNILKEFRKRPMPTVIIVIAIIFIALLTMWLTGFFGEKGRQAASSTPHISEADETNKRLAELSQLKANEELRLATEYPLGYAMIALSGDKNIVLPYTDKFETDWDNIKVYKDDKNIVWIEIPYLRDKRLNSQFKTTSLGLLATPGSKSIKLRFKGSFTAQATCLRANPVGIYLVLGFAEDSQSNP